MQSNNYDDNDISHLEILDANNGSKDFAALIDLSGIEHMKD